MSVNSAASEYKRVVLEGEEAAANGMEGAKWKWDMGVELVVGVELVGATVVGLGVGMNGDGT